MTTPYHKYPRTLHLPWSPGATDDDKVHSSVDHFIGKRIIVSEKFDGENTSMYQDHYHARSLDSKNHPSRNFVKALWGQIRHEIPDGWRISGENLFARHSIHYHHLPAYFLVFAIYNEDNNCLSWDDTLQYAEMLGLAAVPVLYQGVWDEEKVKACWTGKSTSVIPNGGAACGDCNRIFKPDEADDQEGYVVRLHDVFPYAQHGLWTAKYVREHHVQTDEFWMQQPVVPNICKNPS